LDAIPEEEATHISVPGATESTAQLRETGRAARDIPESEHTTISQSGASGVIDAAREVRQAIVNIPDRTVRITVQSIPVIGGLFARGGRVGPEGGIAGEAGPEHLKFPGGGSAFVSSPTAVPPGTLVTPLGSAHHGGAAAVAGYGGGSTAGGGSPITVNVVAPYGSNAAEFGRKVAEGIRDYEKLNGSSWRS
jgi:hypothetical protein